MKLIKKKLTNADIYHIAEALLENCCTKEAIVGADGNTSTVIKEDTFLPIKANYYFQKNLANFVALGQAIDKERVAIFEEYGVKDENDNYTFDPAIVDEANKKLVELFEDVREIKVYKFSIADCGDIIVPTQKMNAMTFMFEEEE